MMYPAKVSVIIPVYNVAEYLPFALQSCIQQTLYDVEFICVNDGSTDNSLEILREYEKIDDRFIVIDKPNGGVSSARNAGLKIATGNWIMFLDPDDYLSEKACERVWIESEEGPTDIINFGTEVVPKQPKPNDWYYYVLNVTTKRFYEFHPNILFKEPTAKPFIWHQAYSKELLDRSEIVFDEKLILGEDQTFLISLYPHASKFAFIEDKLYNYRHVRNNSAMNILRKSPPEMMRRHVEVVRKILEAWEKNGFIEKYGSAMLHWILEFIYGDLKRDYMSDKVRSTTAKKIFSLLEEFYLVKHISDLDQDGENNYKAMLKLVKK